jgi:DNA modification methylase
MAQISKSNGLVAPRYSIRSIPTLGRPILPSKAYSSQLGTMWHGDGLDVMADIPSGTINAIITSPPFALTREKSYGNEPEHRYVDWFMSFAAEFKRILADDGSLVLDLGGAWLPGSPTRSLYQYRLLLRLCDELGFHLAEDFYWFNPAKLPGPREWVTKRRVRVKDSVNLVWWLSKTENPKASNSKVLVPYSDSMKRLLRKKTYNQGERPSGHLVGDSWAQDLGGAIPSNVIAAADESSVLDNFLEIANTSSRDGYQTYCRAHAIPVHPARFPRALPEFFIRMLTNVGDIVLDPFAGSNMTGAIADELGRQWIASDLDKEFIRGSIGRFPEGSVLEFPTSEETPFSVASTVTL